VFAGPELTHAAVLCLPAHCQKATHSKIARCVALVRRPLHGYERSRREGDCWVHAV